MTWLDANKAPEYMRTNFISTGYRANLSIQEAIRSIFQIHNETVQIWAHLLPAVYFWWAAFRYLLRGRATARDNNNSHSRITTNAKDDDTNITFSIYCASFATDFLSSGICAHILML